MLLSTKVLLYCVIFLKRKFFKSRFRGKTNLDKQLHDNISKDQNSAFYPLGLWPITPRDLAKVT